MRERETMDRERPRRWYVSVQSTVYGPFDEAILWSYVKEGRVTAQSYLSPSPSGPFAHAGRQPWLQHWFGDPAPVRPAEPRWYLVIATLQAERTMPFLQTLQSLGDVERLGDTAWIVSTTRTLEQSRAALASVMTANDSLFLLDASDADYETVNFSLDLNQRMTRQTRQSGR